MRIFHEYSNKKFTLQPYNTSTEKDILLLSAMGEPTLDDILDLCNISDEIVSTLTTEEKMALLMKLREISVGSDINLKFECKHCNSGNENAIMLSDIIQESNITNSKIIDKFKTPNDENINDFINTDINIEELDLFEYEVLIKEIREQITKFNFKKPIICQKCKGINHIRIDNKEFIIENMSEDSLKSLYQIYNDMMFFGSYTKQDIDSLYPFERMILVSLLNKTREDQNK